MLSERRIEEDIMEPGQLVRNPGSAAAAMYSVLRKSGYEKPEISRYRQ